MIQHPVGTDEVSTVDALESVLGPALTSVYGDAFGDQFTRYTDGLSQFVNMYGPGWVYVFRAPGRINLIGGHTDYNHGFVLPVALDRDLVLLARPREDKVVHLCNVELDFEANEFVLSTDIPLANEVRWTNYVRGAAQMVEQHSAERSRGMDCLVMGAAPYGVPRASGLSSSSALTVASAIALSFFAELEMPHDDFVQFCSDAEWYVGTRGGIMDQYISLSAERDHTLFLDCRPDSLGRYTTQHVPFSSDYEFVIAESGVRHDNVRGEYNKRVASCRAGVYALQPLKPSATHLRDFEDVDWHELEPLLPDELTVAEALVNGSPIDGIPGLEPEDNLRVKACCYHVWSENRRVRQAVHALQNGDVVQAGSLIAQAHESARDNYAISFPEMETLITASRTVPGVLGGRITGAGWGGCAVFLVEKAAVEPLRIALTQAFEKEYGATPLVYPCRSGSAAGFVASLRL